MKKLISLTLAAVLAASAFASDQLLTPDSSLLTSSASDFADEAWLEARLGTIPDGVTVGTGDSLGIDMADFEDDGYFIRTDGDEVVLCGKSADGLDRAVRYYAKCVKYGNPVEDRVYHEGFRVGRLTVAGRDISEYTVAFVHTQTPWAVTDGSLPRPTKGSSGRSVGNAEFAASEFVRIVAAATGITLPTLDLSGGASLPEHYVLFETDERDRDLNEFGENGYSYRVENGNLIFRGSGILAGCSNGVYYFAEHVLGWAGMTYGDEFLAESEHIDVPEGLEKTGSLTFGHFVEAHCDGEPLRTARNVAYHGYTYHANHGLHKNKFAGDDIDLNKEQPCLTDEYRYEIIRDNVEAYIAGRVDAGEVIGRDFTYVDLGQGDNNNGCTCKNCRAVTKEEGAESGAWVRFANRISDDMNEIYPGLRYLIFAYAYTKAPPKVTKPNDSVNVTFCLDGICYLHGLDSGECWKTTTHTQSTVMNDTYVEWLKTWVEISSYVDVWYYAMDGATSQYALLPVLFEDVKLFRSIGVRGMYMEGEYYGLGVGRFNHEMLPVLQWEPDMTYEEFVAATDEKLALDFGEDSVGAIRAAEELIRQSVYRAGCETCWLNAVFLPKAADYAYIGEKMDGVLALLDDVIEDAPSKDVELRAKRLTLCILYEGIAGRYAPAAEANDAAELARLGELYGLFLDRSVECGFNLDKYRFGFAGKRAVARTLGEEAKLWAK